MNTPSRVHIEYDRAKNVTQWSHEYRAGNRPDLWPYGLNQLFGVISEVDFCDGCRLSRWRRVSPGHVEVLRGVRHSMPLSLDAHDAIIAWDERVGKALAIGNHRGNAVVGTGVIWAPDDLERGVGRLRTALTGKALAKTDLVWTLSRAQLPILKSWLGSLTSRVPRVEFLEFGIDTNFFAPARDRRPDLVISVGVDRDRDTATLYAALAEVRNTHPNVQMLVQSRSQLPAPAGVRVIPHMTHLQLKHLYQQATVCVIATRPNSHVSGMTVALEAQASGCPVIITGTAGVEDYVKADERVHPAPGDWSEIAVRIRTLLHDPDRSLNAGELARKRVVARNSTAQMSLRIAEILATTVEERR